MKTYRAYLIDKTGKIVWGEWIEAASQDEAVIEAHKLCKEGTPTVELWLGAAPVAEIPCASPPSEAVRLQA